MSARNRIRAVAETLRERHDVSTRCEEDQKDRRLTKHALALYSDVEATHERRINAADRATS